MSKLLIIHPEDQSTDFIKKSYQDIDATIVNNPLIKFSELIDLIKNHDKILMIGHGYPYGLFRTTENVTHPKQLKYLIDRTMVKYLKEKECFFFWCFANEFVSKHNLTGFSTGMFISDLDEITHIGVYEDNSLRFDDLNIANKKLNESNDLSVKAINAALKSDDFNNTFNSIYNIDVNPSNEVLKYNTDRLYYFDDSPKKIVYESKKWGI